MSAFFNLDERKQSSKPLFGKDRKLAPGRITPEMITKDFMTNVLNNTSFYTEIINTELDTATTVARLTTPSHVCDKIKDTDIPQTRQRHIS